MDLTPGEHPHLGPEPHFSPVQQVGVWSPACGINPASAKGPKLLEKVISISLVSTSLGLPTFASCGLWELGRGWSLFTCFLGLFFYSVQSGSWTKSSEGVPNREFFGSAIGSGGQLRHPPENLPSCFASCLPIPLTRCSGFIRMHEGCTTPAGDIRAQERPKLISLRSLCDGCRKQRQCCLLRLVPSSRLPQTSLYPVPQRF